ncbi:MAG: perosamine synthetase [Candidatus Latescibacterota bacterium]|jgi:perosamine synthetase
MIPHSRPSLGIEEEQAALRVIRSGMLAQGAEVELLEQRLSEQMAVKHVIAVNSGSAALHLALRVLDLPTNSNVILPSYVCTALLNALQLVGATPVISDIDPQTYQLLPHSQQQTQIHAILAPHMFGHTVDLEPLQTMGVPIIEDCALALGAHYKDRPVGSYGTLAVCSFYATKVICGGEGGAIATSDDSLAAHLRDLRDYDGRKDSKLRYNYKLTDLQAAIIHAQLDKLELFLKRRRDLGKYYSQVLSKTQATLPTFKAGEFPFRYVVTHPKDATDIIAAFESHGISVRNPVFYPLHNVLGLDNATYPHTTHAHKHAVSIPLYPDLSDTEVDHILQAAQEVL